MPIQLTPEQRDILAASDKNLYISAAPGSGKSTMLSQICSKLLEDPNNRVMLVTFTNKAAESIVKKCETLDKARIISGTFHSIAYRLLKKNGCKCSICDEHKKRIIIKTIFNCRKDKDKFEAIYEHISNAKNKFPPSTDPTVTRYNQELQKYNLLDFDDIIYQFIENFSRQVNNEGESRLTHCLVDELQDTSGPQLEMVKTIQNRTQCNIIGVADDDQTIYAWRGARPENVQDFISTFKCNVMNMGINFRSDKNIVKHAVKLIENNKARIQKVIQPFSKEDGKILQFKADNPFQQIDWTVLKCLQNPDTEIAILYRNRTFKYHLEFELRKNKLDYKVNDFLDITDRSAVRVMISCLKIASDKYDIFDIEQAAKALKGIGDAGVKKLKEEADKSSLPEVIKQWMADPKKQKKVASIKYLQDEFTRVTNSALDVLVRLTEKVFLASFDYQPEMREFLIDITKSLTVTQTHIHQLADELGLNGTEETEGTEGAKIELSTVHGYKGLEQPVIIMPWCEMYLEPKPGKKIEIEDERRLFYVGVTRAKNKLYMSYSGATPRFIREMEL
jgi:DNA helicase-2/ATP-dependent DNA helicase PcrA